METMVAVSVVVCTYNRCDQLRQSLLSLAQLQRPSGGACEIVVVDNNSSDATRTTVEACAARSPHLLRYVFERRRGLAYARNAGVRSSRAGLIACTDDDCFAAPDWAAALVDEFARDLSIAVMGGRVELYDPHDAPLATRTARERCRVSSLGDVFSLMIGCNLAFRREVFNAIGGYDERFGRPGGTTGDDVDFVYRAMRQGFPVVYSPRPVIFHAHGRRTPAQIRAAQRMYARGKGAFFGKHIAAGDWRLLRNAYWELAGPARQAMRGLRTRGPVRDDLHFIRDFVAGATYLLRRRFTASPSD